MNRKFIPSIYIYKGQAVKSIQDKAVLMENPVELATYYCENNCDELILIDLSENDQEHEAHLDIFKDICAAAEVDVIGTGSIKRMEDVKKILYTGCKKAILDYDFMAHVDITEEVSLKFGKEKLICAVSNLGSISIHKERIEKYFSMVYLKTYELLKEDLSFLELPMIVEANELPLNKLMQVLTLHSIYGVTGQVINANAKEILSIKELCIENHIPIETLEPEIPWSKLKKNSDGMVPVIVQDYRTNEVLMMAYMNEEAYLHTLKTGKMTYYSRSRQELWLKGETSGHYQYVKSLSTDCDLDTILAKVSQVGAACHTGARSCFFNDIAKKDVEIPSNPLQVFEEVFDVIKDRKLHPKEGSYTNYLFDKGIDKILKKLGEEATEIVIAAKNPNANEIKYEISDFLYHCMVLMAEKEVTWEDITTELANR